MNPIETFQVQINQILGELVHAVAPLLLPDGSHLWTVLSDNIDATLKAVGLSLQRWYVLAALLVSDHTETTHEPPGTVAPGVV